jgi:hypothetical protein
MKGAGPSVTEAEAGCGHWASGSERWATALHLGNPQHYAKEVSTGLALRGFQFDRQLHLLSSAHRHSLIVNTDARVPGSEMIGSRRD